MIEQRIELVPIASARSLGEAINIQMLLDRARLPYRMRGDNLFSIYGDAALNVAGPIEFLIPRELFQQAQETLSEIFDVNWDSLPSQCPACDMQIPKAELDCPNCGLYLG